MDRNEGSAVSDALDAEKAAKDAAAQEVKTLKSLLKDKNDALQLQQELAQKIGETAAQVFRSLLLSRHLPTLAS